ncbi:MAG: hypothetical protein JWR69_93 [Pedosphaera sp.]|nr:hypothetical protein [Pedosphaera sp.]
MRKSFQFQVSSFQCGLWLVAAFLTGCNTPPPVRPFPVSLVAAPAPSPERPISTFAIRNSSSAIPQVVTFDTERSDILGLHYFLDASSNQVNWQVVAEFPPTGQPARYTNSFSDPCGFYRAYWIIEGSTNLVSQIRHSTFDIRN